ncbi:Zn-dependent exopeptidase [Piedraia hortae CBS 480.64]|uniref:Zn-dependent exopeptidase n=1 Tax=Piedraia hortae CBS 480.64 TaxID=1314780 RepID=A0A6A7C7M6_9PEZI|nr:Zn-dependent exopeptidase [Piedraia hortae CBS 480.64]
MSAKLTTDVDKRLLMSTKFPSIFSTKVDMQKVNGPVIKKWISDELLKILGNEDEVVTELVYNLIEGSRYPDIKRLQISLQGFLEKDAPKFCEELWKLCISAQESAQGIPKVLLEAKKQEILRERMKEEHAREEERQRLEIERERELDRMNCRDVRNGRHGRDRGRRRRSPRRYNDRRIDSYVPRRRSGSPISRSIERRSRRLSPSRSPDKRRKYSPPPRQRVSDDSNIKVKPPPRLVDSTHQTMKKQEALPTVYERPPSRKLHYILKVILSTCLICLLLYTYPLVNSTESPKETCSQAEPLTPPTTPALDKLWTTLHSPSYRALSIASLSGAVQIETETHDDFGPVGHDPRWDKMTNFSTYLTQTFSRVNSALSLEKVNTHGLVYTWRGRDEGKKPLVLMAHYDTVPVAASTVSEWEHPPFSGFYDGTFVHGRGANDCKNSLIAILEAVEGLLKAGFVPRRTTVLAFGFDEEISGLQGARYVAGSLRERYGDDGVAAIVDEGFGMADLWGRRFAIPGVGEKGYTDVKVSVRLQGGHSSVPPRHTAIGILAKLITEIEGETYTPYLDQQNPVGEMLQCGARYADSFPHKLRKLLGKGCRRRLAAETAKTSQEMRYLLQTSQAVDVVSGGVKLNALPERAEAWVNHRVNVGEKPEMVWDRLEEIAKKVGKEFDLKVHAWDGKEEQGSICLHKENSTLLPAPVSPSALTKGGRLTPFAVLAGTTRSLYTVDDEPVVVSPMIMTGNTDTRHYWDLTKHIFRYGPGYDPNWENDMKKVHTVNERISVENHLSTVRWYVKFIQNFDNVALDGE